MADERFRIIFEGDGKGLEETLQKLDRALENLSRADPFEKLTRTSERLDASLSALTDRVSSGFGAVGQAIEQLSATLQKIPVEQAEKLEQGMERVRQSTDRNVLALGRMQQAFAAVAHGATRAFDAIGSQGRQALEGVGRQVQSALSGIGGSLSGIGAGGLSGNLFSGLIEGARDAVTGVLSSMNQLAQGVLGAAQTVVSSVYTLMGELQKAGATAIGGLVGALTPLGGLVGGLVGNAVGAALKAAQDLQAGLVNMGLSVAQGVADLATGAVTAAVNVATQLLNGIVTVAQNVVERVAQAFSDLVGRVGGIVGDVVSKVTLGITGLAGVAATQSVKFRDQMAVVWGLLPEMGREAFEKLTAEVADVMSETPFIPWTEGARGLFAAISAGITEPKEAVDALRGAIDLAVGGGMRELGTAMEATSRLMQNFGLTGRDAADAVYQIQKAAQLRVSDVAQGIGVVIEPTVRAKLALEELGAVIAHVSKTLPAAETFTAVARAISSLINPTDTAQKAFDSLGISLRDQSGRLRPMLDIVSQLRETGATDVQLSEMFPNERAIRAIGLLVQATNEDLENLVDLMGNRTGVAAAAAAKAAGTLGGQLSNTWSAWTGLIDATVGRVEGPLMTALGDLQDTLHGLKKSPGFNAIADWAGRALASVVRLVEKGLIYVSENHEAIEKAARRAWTTVETVATTAWGVLKTTYGLLSKWVTEDPEGKIAVRWEKVTAAGRDALTIIQAYASGDVEPLRLAFERLWTYVEGKAKETFTAIAAFASEKIAGLLGLASEGIGLFAKHNPGIAAALGLTTGVDLETRDSFTARNTKESASRLLSALDEQDASDFGGLRGSQTAIDRNWLRQHAGVDVADLGGEELRATLKSIAEGARETERATGLLGPAIDQLREYSKEMEEQQNAIRQAFEQKNAELRDAYDRAIGAWRSRGGEAPPPSPSPSLGVLGAFGAAGMLGPLGPGAFGVGAAGASALSSSAFFQVGPGSGSRATEAPSIARHSDVATAGSIAKSVVDMISKRERERLGNQIMPVDKPVAVRIVEDLTGRKDGSQVDSSPFGLRTGGPQGIRVDELRANQQRLQAMRAEQQKLLADLAPTTRQNVMQDLPEHYSLNQLRNAIKAYGPEPTPTMLLSGQAAWGKQPHKPGERGAGWRGPAEGTTLEDAERVGQALRDQIAENLGQAASSAEKAAGATDQAASEAAAAGSKLAEELRTLATTIEERGAVEEQLHGEQLAHVEAAVGAVSAEVERLRKLVEETRRAKEQAGRQFSGSKGRA